MVIWQMTLSYPWGYCTEKEKGDFWKFLKEDS